MVRVKRIVPNLEAEDPAGMAAFYRALFDLDVLMDMGWIVTLGNGADTPVQLSVASEGGSGTPVPHLSIEVDDPDAVHARALENGAEVVYPLTDEPWGARRFFVRDPGGRIINVLTHLS